MRRGARAVFRAVFPLRAPIDCVLSSNHNRHLSYHRVRRVSGPAYDVISRLASSGEFLPGSRGHSARASDVICLCASE